MDFSFWIIFQVDQFVRLIHLVTKVMQRCCRAGNYFSSNAARELAMSSVFCLEEL